jgi:hypothetical protein
LVADSRMLFRMEKILSSSMGKAPLGTRRAGGLSRGGGRRGERAGRVIERVATSATASPAKGSRSERTTSRRRSGAAASTKCMSSEDVWASFRSTASPPVRQEKSLGSFNRQSESEATNR